MSTANAHLQCGNLLFSCILSISLSAKCSVPKSAGFSTFRYFCDGLLSARHRFLHPQDLGMEMSHSSTPRLDAIAFDAVTSIRLRGLTTFAMSAAMDTAPRAVDALLINASHSVSPEHVATTFLGRCRRCKDMPTKHHVRRRSRPSGLRAARPVAV